MKTRMIRWFCLLLSLLLTVSFIGCQEPQTEDPADKDNSANEKPNDEKTDEEKPNDKDETDDKQDAANDGVFNAKDYDPKKN